MIVISTFFKSESLQITFMSLNLANCDFCIRDDEFWVSHYHKMWITHVNANSQMSELSFNFQTLEVKSTFESKYDINEVSHILHVHRQHFFSFLRKHFYILVQYLALSLWLRFSTKSSSHLHQSLNPQIKLRNFNIWAVY